MRPHAKNMHNAFVGKIVAVKLFVLVLQYLIDKSMLTVDAP
jgi:hypothetical protein